MSEQAYRLQAKKFEQLIHEGRQWKDNDPSKALDCFKAAEEIFPTAQGIDQWITYLSAKIEQLEQAKIINHSAKTIPAESFPLKNDSALSAKTIPAESFPLKNDSTLSAKTIPAESFPLKNDSALSAKTIPAESFSPENTESTPPLKKETTEKQEVSTEQIVTIDQSQIKNWVRQANQADKAGDQTKALGFLAQAISMLQNGKAAPKVILKILDLRNKISPDAEHIYQSACLLQKMDMIDKAIHRLDMVVRKERHHIKALEMKVDITENVGSSQRHMTSLLALSDAYQHNEQFTNYDKLQKKIKKHQEKRD